MNAIQNEPLFLQTFTDGKEDDQLALQYHMHTSLDIIEEKVAGGRKAYPGSRDMYLGLLFTVENFALYGYATNTKIKLVLLVEGTTSSSSVKTWMREFHELYMGVCANPFVELLDQKNGLNTSTFRKEVRAKVVAFKRRN
eukprot:CAMPEP_0170175176 /NCGR_PEP_ID=MMETSP0040_2-20121228/8307_1 /TAXON_ID=641309 /ORGANISM="Lotharella oceanica, Strain CCMP622" /LENGTH=139 /DNA_ID=CAMNT_0010417081 /DNA_START=122 /DNA_END=541 /DNA_ORIENTATION=+